MGSSESDSEDQSKGFAKIIWNSKPTESTEKQPKKYRLLKCALCKNEMQLNEKTLRVNLKRYHQGCARKLISPKPKLDSKVKEKPTSHYQKLQKKFDSVLIAITCGIFFVLFLGAYLMFSTLTLISISLAAVFVVIMLAKAKGTLKSKHKPGSYSPPAFSLLMIISPILFSTLVAFEGYSLWDSIVRATMLWGLTLTFWSTMLFIPISVYSKYREDNQPPPTSYPLLTILVPAYNEEKVIARTLDSILNTDYPQKEVIAIDDGSKDKTLEIMNRYYDRVKVIHKENGGKASALNYGLAFARGDYVVIVDADTVLAPQSLKHLTKGFQNGSHIAAVAGNIKVRNKINWLTWCQALEYIVSIQIVRRAFDYFGAITIIPGALGVFKKSFLVESGAYDKNTIVEDFDATIKVLKSGNVIQGTTQGIAYTEVPQRISDFVKQRRRWYRGNLQVAQRHADVLTNPKFGFLQQIAYPYMIISMIVMPFAGILVMINAVISILMGDWQFVLQIFALFVGLQYLQSALAIRIDRDDPKVILFSIFFVLGYKQLMDVLLIRAIFETLFKKKARWTHAQRIGFTKT
ncbi:MAG: glycosyltransferase family 2 protein [Thaumarchaeota archaeon]|nr:glycosyltransferase family 2 protein [Nitrososphaerota archaeon]